MKYFLETVIAMATKKKGGWVAATNIGTERETERDSENERKKVEFCFPFSGKNIYIRT